jgi:hypothetical protein
MLAAILALVAQIAPVISDAGSITNIITTLEGFVSAATAEVEAVLPMIKNIIAALKSNGAVTADQMAALNALDAATDAAFEQAAAADGAPVDPNAPPAAG